MFPLADLVAVLSVLRVALVARACGDGPAHAPLGRRATPLQPLPAPARPLVWGDVCDPYDGQPWLASGASEGVLAGAELQWGSLTQALTGLYARAGTGLSDGFPDGGVDGHESSQFIAELPYDVLSIGNHELYVYANMLDMHQNFAPKFPGRYLTSNVNITIKGADGKMASVPVGSRFAKFKTRKGRKVTSLGVLFDFAGNSANTAVQKVEDMVKEACFADAIREEPDFFLLVGHMPLKNDKWPVVFNALRAIHPMTPILLLGGHSHTCDCQQYDGRSTALQSGRYMETIGWHELDEKNHGKDVSFNRRYLDANVVTYEYHTGQKNETFDTAQGREITKGLNKLSDDFDLSFTYGTVPQDYTLNSGSSHQEQPRPIPKYIITNEGVLHDDLYKGPFTRNDQLTVSPYADAYSYIPNIALSVAQTLLNELNKKGETRRSLEDGLYERGEVGMRYKRWLEEMDARHGLTLRAASNLTLGYVTKDGCPGVGDDVPHAPLPFFPTPAFLASRAPDVPPNTPIDLVYVNYIERELLQVLNGMQSARKYTEADGSLYTGVVTKSVLGLYAAAGGAERGGDRWSVRCGKDVGSDVVLFVEYSFSLFRLLAFWLPAFAFYTAPPPSLFFVRVFFAANSSTLVCSNTQSPLATSSASL
ncbi:hypothetical protein EVG20_g4987 [Dentipellis fragilis]|uniref:Putative 5'-nucleotidase C-terminal domain-containing protein n=1 Tax=Dentipellis fragilis TaxID=205917 RepID=A0A4Y9YUP4_9AGAM|nr:hypothetical protein EVG20_g4987 [Dentipellis fragilis]